MPVRGGWSGKRGSGSGPREVQGVGAGADRCRLGRSGGGGPGVVPGDRRADARRELLPGPAGTGQVLHDTGQGGDRRIGRGRRGYAHGVEHPVQPGRLRTPLPVHDLFRILLPVHRRPVRTALRRAAVEEAGGEQGGGLVGDAGLFEQVARGALAEARGEAVGQPVAAGELGEGGDHSGVQPGGPAGPSARRAARPGSAAGPSPRRRGRPAPGRRCGARSRRPGRASRPWPPRAAPSRRHAPGRRAAAAGATQPAKVTGAPRSAPRPGAAPSATAASRPRTKRRAAAMSADARTSSVPATTGARTARSSATRIHHRNGEPITRTGAVSFAFPPGSSPVGTVGAVRTVLQPAVAVRGQRYGRGRGDAEPVSQVPDQPVEVGGPFLRHGDGRARCGPRPPRRTPRPRRQPAAPRRRQRPPPSARPCSGAACDAGVAGGAVQSGDSGVEGRRAAAGVITGAAAADADLHGVQPSRRGRWARTDAGPWTAIRPTPVRGRPVRQPGGCGSSAGLTARC
ncbi:hypothetical protein SMICM17S_08185 [Streptomyces microflavus]